MKKPITLLKHIDSPTPRGGHVETRRTNWSTDFPTLAQTSSVPNPARGWEKDPPPKTAAAAAAEPPPPPQSTMTKASKKKKHSSSSFSSTPTLAEIPILLKGKLKQTTNSQPSKKVVYRMVDEIPSALPPSSSSLSSSSPHQSATLSQFPDKRKKRKKLSSTKKAILRARWTAYLDESHPSVSDSDSVSVSVSSSPSYALTINNLADPSSDDFSDADELEELKSNALNIVNKVFTQSSSTITVDPILSTSQITLDLKTGNVTTVLTVNTNSTHPKNVNLEMCNFLSALNTLIVSGKQLIGVLREQSQSLTPPPLTLREGTDVQLLARLVCGCGKRGRQSTRGQCPWCCCTSGRRARGKAPIIPCNNGRATPE